jgi:signal recognition particle receptor subunit beta
MRFNTEVELKIIYCGSKDSGKSTNIKKLGEFLKDNGRIVTLIGKDGISVCFEFLKPALKLPNGLEVKYKICACPGRCAPCFSGELICSGIDGIVFVVDSGAEALENNKKSWSELKKLLKKGKCKKIPIVFQYNKRDLETALPVGKLRKELNVNNYPEIEAVAIKGIGVVETFKEIAKLSLVNSLKG